MEAAFALHALAGARVAVTILAPEAEFVAPEDGPDIAPPRRYPLDAIATDAGAEHLPDAFRWLDATERIVHTRAGRELPYDALLLALGARARPAFRHALTLDARRLHEQAARLGNEIRQGTVRSVAALVPSTTGWALPIYQLCLWLARLGRELASPLAITLLTPEEAPLAVFGDPVSTAVGNLLEEEGISAITSVACEVREPGVVSLRPGVNLLRADRIVALPGLSGPSTPGVPKRARGGFLSVDVQGRVRGLHDVYAAGDATEFTVKTAVAAAAQADLAAGTIAAAAGAAVDSAAEAPVIRGALRGERQTVHLSAQLLGVQGCHSQLTGGPERSPFARHLAPYLATRDRAATR